MSNSLFFPLCFAVLLGIPNASSPELETQIESIRQKYAVPALAAMEWKDSRVTNFAFTGFRKTGNPTPFAASDQFHLGSDTKAMTATVIGILV